MVAEGPPGNKPVIVLVCVMATAVLLPVAADPVPLPFELKYAKAAPAAPRDRPTARPMVTALLSKKRFMGLLLLIVRIADGLLVQDVGFATRSPQARRPNAA